MPDQKQQQPPELTLPKNVDLVDYYQQQVTKSAHNDFIQQMNDVLDNPSLAHMRLEEKFGNERHRKIHQVTQEVTKGWEPDQKQSVQKTLEYYAQQKYPLASYPQEYSQARQQRAIEKNKAMQAGGGGASGPNPESEPTEFIKEVTNKEVKENLAEFHRQAPEVYKGLTEQRQQLAQNHAQQQFQLQALQENIAALHKQYPSAFKAEEDKLYQLITDAQDQLKSTQKHLDDLVRADETPITSKIRGQKAVLLSGEPIKPSEIPTPSTTPVESDQQILTVEQIGKRLTPEQRLQVRLQAAAGNTKKTNEILRERSPDDIILLDTDSLPSPPTPLGNFAAWRRHSRINNLQKSIELQSGQTLSDNNAYPVMLAMRGYSPSILHHWMEDYKKNHANDPDFQDKYNALQDQFIQSRDWYAIHNQDWTNADSNSLPGQIEQYHQDLQTPIFFDQDGQPIVVSNQNDKTLAPIEEQAARAKFQMPRPAQSYANFQSNWQETLRQNAFTQRLSFLPNSAGRLAAVPSSMAGNFSNLVSKLKSFSPGRLSNQALLSAKAGAQGLMAKLSKGAVMKAAGTAVGGFLSGGTMLLALGAFNFLQRLYHENREAFKAVASWIMIKLGGILSNTAAMAGGAIGGSIGTFFLGPVGFLPGFALGYGAVNWFQNLFGGTTQAASHAAGAVVGSPVTTTKVLSPLSTTEPTLVSYTTSRGFGMMDVIVNATPGATFFLVTAVGPFILAAFLTWFTMMVLLGSFTVPNPLQPNFDITKPNQPGYTGVNPNFGSTVSLTGTLKDILDGAAQAACVPPALLEAIIRTEAPGTLSFTDDELNSTFNRQGWWLTAAPDGGSCYDRDYPDRSQPCGRGYCYDTCTSNGLCPAYDVRGSTQFERYTFYGGSCPVNDGLDSNGNAHSSCRAGHVPFIIEKVVGDPNYVPNRCLVSDVVATAAHKLAADSSIVTFGPNFSCSYNPTAWDPKSASVRLSICRAAQAYCGNCGLVSRNDTSQPCWEVYKNTAGDKNCGGANSIGHCNLTYNHYVEALAKTGN